MSTFNRKIANLIRPSGDVKISHLDNIPTGLDSATSSNLISNNLVMDRFDSINALPITGLVRGKRAYIDTDSNNGLLYLSNGQGWYNISLTNTSPSLNFDSSLYTLDSENDSVLITFSDSDFDQVNLQDAVIRFKPANITDSAINSNIVGSNITLTVRDSASGAYSFQILGSISDGLSIGTDSATITLTLFTFTPDIYVLGSTGSTILNVDSDVEGGTFRLASGDTLQDSTGAITATVSSATFLDDTEQDRLYAGRNNGQSGVGLLAVDQGTVDSSHIGRILNWQLSRSDAASNFRTGNQYGGQILNHISQQNAQWSPNTTNLSSMYIHGAVGGSFYRSYAGVVCTQYTLQSSGGSTRKGTLPIHSTNQYETWSPYADGKKNGVDHKITMKVDGLTSGNQGVNYNWPIKNYTQNWTYRNVNVRSNNGTYIGAGTSMQTSMVLDGNQQSNFPVGGVVHIGEDATINSPSYQEVYEGKFFVIAMTCYFSQNINPGFNMSTAGSYGTVQKWSGATNNNYYFGVGAQSGQTGIILVGHQGYTQNSVWGNTLQTSTSANGMNQNIPMYVRSAFLCNEVYIISPDYPLYNSNHNFVTSGYGTDLRPTFSEWSSTNNASGNSYGNSTYPIYKQSSSAATKLEFVPSPAGDGTNVDFQGSSNLDVYLWKNQTKVVVDDNTGLTTVGRHLKYTDT